MPTLRSTVLIQWVKSITKSLGKQDLQCFWNFNFIFLKLNSLKMKLNFRRQLRNLINSPLKYAVYNLSFSCSFYSLKKFHWNILRCCYFVYFLPLFNFQEIQQHKKEVINYSLWLICHLSWRLIVLGNNNYTWISFIRQKKACTFSKSSYPWAFFTTYTFLSK